MKKRKPFITNMILVLLCASIPDLPSGQSGLWVFTGTVGLAGICFPQVLGPGSRGNSSEERENWSHLANPAS